MRNVEAGFDKFAASSYGTGMVRPTAKFQKQQTQVLRQIRKMREEMGDLQDYLDLLEARAVNEGKGTYSTDEVKAKLGIK
jgi:hypothetical protein